MVLSVAPRAFRRWCIVCWMVLGIGMLAACGETSPGRGTGGAPPGSEGFVVVNTDYHSSSVSLVAASGEVLSPQFISSASAAPGLSAAFGGDVVLPSMPATGGEVVLIDRLPTGVLSWVGLDDARVRGQLSVATGFASNPQDYVSISSHKAYVMRLDPNLAAGEQAFDRGSDVLIVDPSERKVTGSIDLSAALAGEDAGFYPYPDRAVLAGGLLRVLALAFNIDFTDRRDSRMVSIDPESDRIVSVTRFTGLHSCSVLTVSPSGDEIAVGCNGAFNQAGAFPDSGIVVLDVAPEPQEKRRFLAADLGGAQISALDYASSDSLVFTTYGRFSADRRQVESQDTLRRLDLVSGSIDPEPLAQTTYTPFSFGDVRCDVAAQVCVLCDAETEGGVLHRFEVTASGTLTQERLLPVDTISGLPPRYLQPF